MKYTHRLFHTIKYKCYWIWLQHFFKVYGFPEWAFFVSNLQNPLLINVIWGELPSDTLHLKTRLFSLHTECLYWFSTTSVSVCSQTPENSLRRENILQAARCSPEGSAESCVNSGSSNVWLIKYKRTFPSNLLLLTMDQQIQPEKSRESQEHAVGKRSHNRDLKVCQARRVCGGGTTSKHKWSRYF